MEVLSAADVQSAGALLDELGFPPVDQVGITPDSEAPITDLGAEDETVPPPSSTNTDQTQETAGGIAPDGQPSGGGQGTAPSNGSGPAAGSHGGNGRRGGGDGTDKAKGKPRYAKRSKFRTYVVPEGAETTGADGQDGEGRSEVDEAGVEHVYDYEISQQRNPTIMAHNNPGFDIKSTDEGGIIARYIEIKSSAGEWSSDGVAVSKTQFEHATTHGDVHWLYVVEKATSADFRIFRIQDPAGRVNEFLYDDGWSAVAEPDVTASEEGPKVDEPQTIS
jgi:hypothetical protein